MSTVLVTGGAGYVGSHAAQLLLEQGYDVVVLDNLSTGTRELVPLEAHFVRGDIVDVDLVTSVIHAHDVQAVMHFAAFVDVEESMREPDKYYRNNSWSTSELLNATKQAGVQHFIFSSTAAVYGNPTQVPVPESARKAPVSHYGISKAMAEDSVQKSGLDYAILRYFNVAGTHYRAKLGYSIDKVPTHLIRRAVRVLLGDIDHLDVFGTDYPTPDGSAVRDYIHVRDLVQAHIEVLKYLEAGGASDIFNVGYGKGHSVLEVIKAVENVRPGTVLKVEQRDRRAGDPSMIVADTAKLKKLTNWEPQFESLGGMVLDEVDWVLAQKAKQK